MKILTVIALSLALSSVTHAACNLTLKVVSEKSTTGTINGVNFGKKQIEELSKVCKVTKAPMSVDELIALENVKHEQRVARLAKKK